MFSYDQVPLIPTEDLATHCYGSLARMNGRRRVHTLRCLNKGIKTHPLLFSLYMHKPISLTNNETKLRSSLLYAELVLYLRMYVYDI